VALLILVLAATNYVNLATVRTLRRQREIAVRKVLGASAGRGQPPVPGRIGAGVPDRHRHRPAAGLAAAAGVLRPGAAQARPHVHAGRCWLASCCSGVVVGLLAGAYPTWSALKVRPTAALSGRGNSETAGGLWLRRVLTVLQFATAMGLTGMTLAVAWQTRYASSLDPGFDPAPCCWCCCGDDMRTPTCAPSATPWPACPA
jgi:putative ABC transport system permease protein